MAKLDAKTRAGLPDSAFAYVDSEGRRRLPINDASHVRNALSRFNQVQFEDEAARDRARLRLLNAAKKHGVVPIGFISAQLQPLSRLPKGHVTFLLTDIEGSTALVERLDARYGKLVSGVRQAMRKATRSAGGHEIDARGDEFFAVFSEGASALTAALAIQRAMRARAVAGRRRRPCPDGAAQRTADPHRDRLHRPRRPHGGEDLLRRARRPDRRLSARRGH